MDIVWFNDVSNLDVGLICQSSGRRQRAEEETISYDIPFRDDVPIEHTGKYKAYSRTMQFAWKDKQMTSKVLAWLTGVGKLETSRDPNGFFKVNILTGLSVERQTKKYDSFSVDFLVNPPFFYLYSGETPIVLTSPEIINNPGTHMAEPVIRILGNGNATISINGRIMVFKNIETFIDIDPEIVPPIYKNNQNAGEKMMGELPYLDPGLNEITWTGNVSQINILPRWRDK